MSKERIDKILAGQNICSRSDVKRLVRNKAITVNGVTVSSVDEKADPVEDAITVNGKLLSYRRFLYIMMNKPAGVVSAVTDKNDTTVIDILPPEYRRNGMFPAGRLDKDTEGLLIITDDGEFAHNMLSPTKRIYKRYFAKTDKPLDDSAVKMFADGIVFRSGEKCLPAKLEIADTGCIVTICEGKFHQVKKMLACAEANVLYLQRLSIGDLMLDTSLKPGECRELTEQERAQVFSI